MREFVVALCDSPPACVDDDTGQGLRLHVPTLPSQHDCSGGIRPTATVSGRGPRTGDGWHHGQQDHAENSCHPAHGLREVCCLLHIHANQREREREGGGQRTESCLLLWLSASGVPGRALTGVSCDVTLTCTSGHNGVVLSAFGCGAFQNPPRQMAALFQQVIEQEFRGTPLMRVCVCLASLSVGFVWSGGA